METRHTDKLWELKEIGNNTSMNKAGQTSFSQTMLERCLEWPHPCPIYHPNDYFFICLGDGSALSTI